ncbi:MAG: TetR/AcrR family transcriptional regulator [Ruminococcus flavefaciens]|nr:TetR/AcrR family transcriptional regulator [Ruminococcus flavefaciens]MCM1061466.1 TetR/AcrR family transcriptional regulator [Eubacterium sp.]
MSRGSLELTDFRKEEIINAFDKLFQSRSFRNISMRDIEQEISMTRSSIYNYFKTKEEIFLGLTCKELTDWVEELHKIENNENMTASEFASAVSDTLENKKKMLKLISWNHLELEENSRTERISEVQKITYKAIQIFLSCLDKFFPSMTTSEKRVFQVSFFTFLYGLDSYVMQSQKQIEAIQLTEIPYYPVTVRDTVYTFMMQFLKEDLK